MPGHNTRKMGWGLNVNSIYFANVFSWKAIFDHANDIIYFFATIPCFYISRQERYWSYFLASSLIVFFAGLIVILVFRLARYAACFGPHRSQAEQATDAAKAAAAADTGGRHQPEVRIGCLTRLKWWCEALMSGQTVGGRIVVSLLQLRHPLNQFLISTFYQYVRNKVINQQLEFVYSS